MDNTEQIFSVEIMWTISCIRIYLASEFGVTFDLLTINKLMTYGTE